MSTALSRVMSRPNLDRAWQWTRTNTERAYRLYCGDIWRASSLAIESRLARIRERLKSGTYTPDDATKLLLPKPSGVQRPYTLLSVSDQIVYQAFANVIAERLVVRVHDRYNRSTFGHLYAGRSSPFFYQRWKRSYRLYTDAMRSAYAKGYVYTASFDLTACYDSIDHAVIRHSLRELKLDGEFIDEFLRLLGRWTGFSGGKQRIFHGHGIPQGPLPSGLVAETVLRYFDDADSRRGIKYFRYVDDIRLFAKDERSLRRELVALDVRSKQLGLFPQSSKIHIHRVTRIEDEFKSISLPAGHPGAAIPKSPVAVREELQRLSARYAVPNGTRFKYLLSLAQPENPLAQRLAEIVGRDPALYESAFRYIERVPRLTQKTSEAVMALLPKHDVYPGFAAALLRAVRINLHHKVRRRINAYARKCLTGPSRTRDPQLYASAIAALAFDGKLSFAQMKTAVEWPHSWWTRAACLPFINEAAIGRPSFEALVHKALRDPVADVALVAAELSVVGRLNRPVPIANVHEAGQEVLRKFGVIGRMAKPGCEIAPLVAGVLGPAAQALDWRRLFSPRTYRHVTARFAVWRGYKDTDPTAWVALTDTINDILLGQLFPHDGGIGSHTVGKIGSVLGSTTSAFARKYPKMWRACTDLHSLRLESDLAHPLVKTSGKPTRRIRYRELSPQLNVLRAGWGELHAMW
jgi:retron-type reverse transcriptase